MNLNDGIKSILNDKSFFKKDLISNFKDISCKSLQERGSVELGMKSPVYWSEILLVSLFLKSNRIRFFILPKFLVKKELAFFLYLIQNEMNYNKVSGFKDYIKAKQNFKKEYL